MQNLQCPIGLRVQKADAVGDRIFIEGNCAAALGAVYGGATVCAWYPITPSSSVAEAFQQPLHAATARDAQTKQDERYAIVQAEDELASIGMVIGAGWNGARAFTATSGPGISLMQEFIGLAYFAEIPAVIWSTCSAPAPRPACRRARSSATCSPAPTPRTATPSTCCCSRRIRPRPSSSARAGLRPRRPAADADLRDDSTSTSA